MLPDRVLHSDAVVQALESWTREHIAEPFSFEPFRTSVLRRLSSYSPTANISIEKAACAVGYANASILRSCSASVSRYEPMRVPHLRARVGRTMDMQLVLAAILLGQSAFAPLFNASHWIGSQPTAKQLAGKVVLVDVFTYSCINCKHVVPELQRLRRQYGANDLVIIGVHTPELQSDYVRSNVEQNLALQGITWPVAIDNDEKLWNAYGVNAWPTQLFFDRNGRLRKTIVGDSQDDDVSATVRALVGNR